MGGFSQPHYSVNPTHTLIEKVRGEPLEFTSVDDTGIPALQEWCHALTLPVREEDARKAMSELDAFAVSLRTYVAGAPTVAEAERQSLRAEWESVMIDGFWGDEEYVSGGDLLSANECMWLRKGVVWRLIDVSCISHTDVVHLF